MPGSGPPAKRIKLESTSPEPCSPQEFGQQETAQQEEHCSICLQPIVDRALIPHCSHEFCFECLIVWSEQSRRCPLCSQGIGSYVIHHIRSRYDYQKYYLTPLRTSPRPLQPLSVSGSAQSIINRHSTGRGREWGRRERQQREEADQLERSISKRKWIYRHHLYAKHFASNTYTRYRPFPTPAQFAASSDYMSRTTTFVRRELQVDWDSQDRQFLTTFVLSIMKSIDIRSESAVKLLSEFLDMDEPYVEGGRHPNAEHFAHEIYCYLRSPYRDLYVYDTVAQYDSLPHLHPLPTEFDRTSRWRIRSESRSRSSDRSPSPPPLRLSRHRQASPERPAASKLQRLSRSGSPPRSQSRSRYSNKNRRLSGKRNETRSHGEVDNTNRGEYSPSRNHLDLSGSPSLRKGDEGARAKGKAQETALDLEKRNSRDYGDKRGELTDLLRDDSGTTGCPEVSLSNGIDGRNDLNDEKPRSSKLTRNDVRGGRGRTLLESVQSHLSLPQTNGRRKFRPPNSVDFSAKPTGTDTNPSLLARISKSQVQVMSEGPERSSEANLQQGAKSLSIPDIAAKTGTQIEKLKNEIIAPSAPNPLLLTPTISSSLSATQNPLRHKLLDKLEAEKKQIANSTQALFMTTPEIPPGDALDSESLKAESKLRMQAQLRVRLAAAKRDHEDQHRPQEHSGKEGSQREEALRAKLKESSKHTIDR